MWAWFDIQAQYFCTHELEYQPSLDLLACTELEYQTKFICNFFMGRSRQGKQIIMAANIVQELVNMNQSAVQQVGEGVDMISYLPKELIHHILSFLPTKHVVQTCVLSKRWQSLWKSVRHVEFDEELYYMEGETHEDPVLKFTKFVNTFFILYEGSNIEKFRVSCSDYCEQDSVFTWIRAAIKYRVQELELIIESEDPFQLPHCLFMCQSLTTLKLHLHGCPLILPTSINLPQLKTLHLRSIKFVDNSLSHQLLSNSPNLEILNLRNCELDLGGTFDIAAPKLKVLVLHAFPWPDFGEAALDCKIKIVAPQLVSLTYNGLIAPEYNLQNLPSLLQASFDIRYHDWHDWDITASAITIFRALTSVTVLKLADLTIWLLSSDQYLLNNLPRFNNLNHLSLSSRSNKSQLRSIICLLEHAPNLETLELEVIQVPGDSTERFTPEELRADLLLHHLKVVEIKNLSLCQNHVLFVRRILASAGDLERLTIMLSGVNLRTRRLLKRSLELLPRISSNCIIEVRR